MNQIRIKDVCKLNPSSLSESTDPSLSFDYIDIGSVNNGNYSPRRMTFSESPSRARKEVCEGDIIVSTVRTYLRAIASISKSGKKQVASTGFSVLSPKNIDGNYLKYACMSESFIGQIIASSKGVSYPAVSDSVVVNSVIPMKDISLQKSIAFSLERTMGIADKSIEQLKQKLLALDEYKNALIHNAVTKGLDAKGCRILDGTLEPKTTIRLKDCFKSMCGGIWGDEFKENDSNNIPIARVANFNMDSLTIDWGKGCTVRNVPIVGKLRQLEYNDIILEKSGGGDKTPVGRAVNYQDSRLSTAANFTNILKPNSENDGRFLMYLLNSLYNSAWLMLNIKQNTGIQNLDCPSYLLAEVPLFSIDEQIEISKYLDLKNEQILTTKDSINKKIDLLIEYKKSLINEAVSAEVVV